MKFRNFVITVILGAAIAGSQVTGADSGLPEGDEKLPCCEVVLKDFVVKRKDLEHALLTISAEVINRTGEPLLLDPCGLAIACGDAALIQPKSGIYEVALANRIDGPCYDAFVGEKLLNPGNTNHVSVSLFTYTEGVRLINSDRYTFQEKVLPATNLTYFIKRQATFRKATSGYKKEVFLTGYGKISVQRERKH